MSLLVFVLVAGFLLGALHTHICFWLVRQGVSPTLVAALGIAAPAVAVFIGYTSA